MNKAETLESPETTEDLGCKLILHNDPVNSFDTVIDALQEVLGWNHIQAEQITLIVHHKGKGTLKSGEYMELEKYKYGLEDRGLTVEIQ
jgi:ATP-dependent Clp protease adaptor protein ClpS